MSFLSPWFFLAEEQFWYDAFAPTLVDTIQTYTDTRNQLTGMIDSPAVVRMLL